MKKILLTGLVFAASVTMFAQQLVPVVSSFTASSSNLVVAGRANVREVQIGAGSGTATVTFYDAAALAGPYFGKSNVLASYVSKAAYTTNLVQVFTNAMTGTTDYYTNAGYFTYSVTNAASTNALSPLLSFIIQPNLVQTFQVDTLFTTNVIAFCNTNATVVLYYNRGM